MMVIKFFLTEQDTSVYFHPFGTEGVKKCNNLWGCYDRLEKTVCIILYNFTSPRHGIIWSVCNTISHEYIHKAIKEVINLPPSSGEEHIVNWMLRTRIITSNLLKNEKEVADKLDAFRTKHKKY